MIHENNFLISNFIKIQKLLLILEIFPIAIFADYEKVSVLTSNEMMATSGSGDTVWVVTSVDKRAYGINYTTNITSDSVVWTGYKNIKASTVSFSSGFALINLQSTEGFIESFINPMLVYSHSTASFTEVNFPFKPNIFNSTLDSLKYYFNTTDAAWANNQFWIAAYDGGLISYDPVLNNDEGILFIPGLNDSTILASKLSAEIPRVNPDLKKRVYGVEIAGVNRLWVGCEKQLWLFNTINTTWDSIAHTDGIDTIFSRYHIENISVSKNDTNEISVLFVEDAIDGNRTVIKSYNRDSLAWGSVVTHKVGLITSGYKNDILLQKKETKNSIDRYAKISENWQVVEPATNFKERFEKSDINTNGLEISDYYFTTSESDTILVISTNVGLFYSLDEYSDEADQIPFSTEIRQVQIVAGVENCYSYPSIIMGTEEKAIAHFAYNLKKDANVTIDIFDFNMDFVVRIINEEFRSAGSNSLSGKSSIKERDFWDGTSTNRGGRTVAPGVYFFRIKTDKGEKAFGKVIVAK